MGKRALGQRKKEATKLKERRESSKEQVNFWVGQDRKGRQLQIKRNSTGHRRRRLNAMSTGGGGKERE